MSIKPFFPDSVWNGLSESRKSFYEDRTPDYMDWDRIVVELQAVQSFLLANLIINTHVSTITIDTPGSTVEFDLGLTDWHSITLDQDTIFTLLRPMINQLFYIKIFQGSSNWAITWFEYNYMVHTNIFRTYSTCNRRKRYFMLIFVHRTRSI